MKINPIRTEADYEDALDQIHDLMDAVPGSSRGDRLDVLVSLVESYEDRHWAIDPPDPIDAIKIRMEQRGLTRNDLQQILGSRGRVSEILNRKRSLSIEMMRRLHNQLNIPAASFFREPQKKRGKKASGIRK
jgi:HTH-type transcriptional regulator/antitoxin HigA